MGGDEYTATELLFKYGKTVKQMCCFQNYATVLYMMVVKHLRHAIVDIQIHMAFQVESCI